MPKCLNPISEIFLNFVLLRPIPPHKSCFLIHLPTALLQCFLVAIFSMQLPFLIVRHIYSSIRKWGHILRQWFVYINKHSPCLLASVAKCQTVSSWQWHVVFFGGKDWIPLAIKFSTFTSVHHFLNLPFPVGFWCFHLFCDCPTLDTALCFRNKWNSGTIIHTLKSHQYNWNSSLVIYRL